MAAVPFTDEALIDQLAKSNTQFAVDLYKNVSKTKGNIFLSPISISVALAMTRLGAKGNTESQIDEALKWTAFSDKVHHAFEDYLSVLNVPKTSYTLTMVNRIFVYNKLTLLDEFVEKTAKHFKADAVSADFAGKPVEEKKKINNWVETQTNGKIKDIVSGNIDPLTRLILINAIYFKGNWDKQFKPEDTVKRNFKMSSGETIMIDMMRMSKMFPINRNQRMKCQVLELPYVEKNISMFILLPFEADGLASLEDKMDLKTLTGALTQLEKEEVDITLPKFVIESDFALEKVLPSLGMVDAFDMKNADFSGMTGYVDLYISQVIHKTFLEVSEEGSEAAAATSVTMKTRSLKVVQPFVADHPFMFVIRDNIADMVLFIGRLEKP